MRRGHGGALSCEFERDEDAPLHDLKLRAWVSKSQPFAQAKNIKHKMRADWAKSGYFFSATQCLGSQGFVKVEVIMRPGK